MALVIISDENAMTGRGNSNVMDEQQAVHNLRAFCRRGGKMILDRPKALLYADGPVSSLVEADPDVLLRILAAVAA
jgi:hypothetical protein